MRLLHLSTLYPPHITGGAERSVSLLAEEQVREGHDVAAACLSPNEWHREEREGVSVFRMPHENDFWMEDWPSHTPRQREWAKFKQQANFRIERHFEKVLDAFRPDIVNTHSLVDVSTRVWRAARRRGVPIVHTLRDFDLLCAASSMYRAEEGPCTHRHLKCRVLTFTKQFDQRLVDAVTAVGQDVLVRHLEAGFFGHVPPHLQRVIWNTVDRAPEGRAARHRPADAPFTFGYLGRISPEKGVETLLDACRLLPPGGWTLKIAGAAPDGLDRIKAQAAGLPIEFLGFVEPPALFGQIDVLVTPSLWAEPLGRSVLESYIAGVPVLGSRTGGIAEIIGDDAWLFTPGDATALGARMAGLLAAGRTGLSAMKRFDEVKARTSPQAVAKAFQAIYRSVLWQAGAGAPRHAGAPPLPALLPQ